MKRLLGPVGLALLAMACSKQEAATQQASNAFGGQGNEESKNSPTVVATPMATTAASAAGAGGARDDLAPSGPREIGRDKEAWGIAPATQAQIGPVKAGEWDDNANYREFQRFLGATSANYHKVDVRSRRFLVVRDSEGKAIPRCKVTVGDDKQHEASFVTTASGRAIFFPYAEDFTGKDFTATARCDEGATSAKFALSDDDAAVDLKLPMKRASIQSRPVDIAFVLDTTGSMSEEIAAVKSTIQKVAKSLGTNEIKVRIGLVEFKDKGDDNLTKVYPMSSDLAKFQGQIAGVFAGGGGDIPEHMTAGLHDALTKLDWSKDAVARVAFVIGDAPPHLDYQDGLDYVKEMKDASHRGIQLFTVAASGMDDLGQVVWRQMAQYTGGSEMFVMRGGAGPQSTGGGDPLASCGGTQQQYASGNLDELIVGKIKRELKAIDGDPMRIAGLTKDESAKPCAERIF
jgi:Mg-chelatase subunit ChlD